MKSQDIKALIKETRKEMKAKGIKRTSCFNGGLSTEVYSLNARMFQLETQLEAAEKIEKSADCPESYGGHGSEISPETKDEGS